MPPAISPEGYLQNDGGWRSKTGDSGSVAGIGENLLAPEGLGFGARDEEVSSEPGLLLTFNVPTKHGKNTSKFICWV